MALELRHDGELTTVTDADLMPPDGDPETSYTIRHISIEKNREIVKLHTQQVVNKRTHQKDPQVDWEAAGDALLDYALSDWSGIVSGGAPLPCTLETKRLLDGPRRSAILERAGLNEIAAAPERRAESFRPSA